jgi:hypothetical protein
MQGLDTAPVFKQNRIRCRPGQSFMDPIKAEPSKTLRDNQAIKH